RQLRVCRRSPHQPGQRGACPHGRGRSPLPVARLCHGSRGLPAGDRRHPPVAQRASGTSLTGWVALHSVVHIPHRETIVLKALKKLFKPGKRSEEHTSELQSRENLVCRLLLEK